MTETPALRWGVVGCGLISSWFVGDLQLNRPEAKTKHVIQCIGSSSAEKGKAFLGKNAPTSFAKIYTSYEEVYNDPDVDIVYIGTPHSVHVVNALDAINAGKNVLCEKPVTINSKQTEKLIAAAKEKNVFFMEAVWTRFFPIISAIQKYTHGADSPIGDISRVFIDFGLDMPIASLPPSSRSADRSLGAGSLLDIGIYTLTWASIILDQHPKNKDAPPPSVSSSMTFTNDVDEICSIILNYPQQSAQAICTCSMKYQTQGEFCRMEGSRGSLSIGGVAGSKPGYLILKEKGKEEEKKEFHVEGFGFYFEADAVAEDLRAGRKQSSIMPLAESLRMMKLMDEIRKQNGLVYPQDE